jgi:hypothetical protein
MIETRSAIYGTSGELGKRWQNWQRQLRHSCPWGSLSRGLDHRAVGHNAFRPRWDAGSLAADLPDLLVLGRMGLVSALAFDSPGQDPTWLWSEAPGRPCDARAGLCAADKADWEPEYVDLRLDNRHSRVPGWHAVESLCACAQCFTHCHVAYGYSGGDSI